jgi:hypothetical protein
MNVSIVTLGVSEIIRQYVRFLKNMLKNRRFHHGTNIALGMGKEVIMKNQKITKICAMIGLAIIVVLYVVGCEQPLTGRDIAEEALDVLKSWRGAATYVTHEDGSHGGFGILSVDSFYIDDTTYGVRSVGWIYWDDNNTPPDTTDDTFKFIGQNEYLDWNFTENWFLKMKVGPADRETEMAVKNLVSEESVYVHFDKVNRPGGVQTGPGTYSGPGGSIDVIMGIHHAETPDIYEDNYSWLEFFMEDNEDPTQKYWVHADFRPDDSGSGKICLDDVGGPIIATFQWDEFGRGTLVVDGGTYPFEW